MTDPEAALWDALYAAEYDHRFALTMKRVGPTLSAYQGPDVKSTAKALNEARDAIVDYLWSNTT